MVNYSLNASLEERREFNKQKKVKLTQSRSVQTSTASGSIIRRARKFLYRNRKKIVIITMTTVFFVVVKGKTVNAQDLDLYWPYSMGPNPDLFDEMMQELELNERRRLRMEIASKSRYLKELLQKEYCSEFLKGKLRKVGRLLCKVLFKLKILGFSKNYKIILSPFVRSSLLLSLIVFDLYILFLGYSSGAINHRPRFIYKMIGHQVYQVIAVTDDTYQ